MWQSRRALGEVTRGKSCRQGVPLWTRLPELVGGQASTGPWAPMERPRCCPACCPSCCPPRTLRTQAEQQSGCPANEHVTECVSGTTRAALGDDPVLLAQLMAMLQASPD